MSAPIDRHLRDARPTDAEIDAEFTRARQDQILQEVLVANQDAGEQVQPGAAVGFFEDPARRRRVWPLLAAAVAVIAVGALVVPQLVPSGAPTVLGAPPSTAVSTPGASSSASSSSRPSATASSVPSASASSATGGLPEKPAVDMLTQVAENAGNQEPLTVGPREFLHLLTVVPATGDEPELVWDQYYTSDGWVWQRHTGQVNSWNLSWHENPLGTADMTPEEIKALFLSLGGSNSKEERLFGNAAPLLSTHPLVTPGQRKSLILMLQDLAKHPVPPYPRDPSDPQNPWPTASPTLSVTTVALDNGETGYRLFFQDKTGPKPDGDELILDANGNTPVAMGVTYTREVVTDLPPEFVEKLGTKKVTKSVQG